MTDVTGGHRLQTCNCSGVERTISIAEPYLYEPGVEHQLLLRSLTIMKGFTTPTGEAKASIILVVNLELTFA